MERLRQTAPLSLVPALLAALVLAGCEHALSEPGDYEAGSGIAEEDTAEVPGSNVDILYADEDAPEDERGLPVAERLVDPEDGIVGSP